MATRPRPPSSLVTPEIPGVLGPFTLLTRIARGGMADVILAEATQRPEHGFLAVKLLLPRLAQRRKFIDMFRSEGKLGSMLNHPNIARTTDVGHSGPVHYIAMEFIDGQDLGRVIRYFRTVEAPVPIETSLFVVREVVRGLGHAHELVDENFQPIHLVNRDVSPANVMLGYDGSVRLIDFGIAQANLDYRSQIGSIKGKVSYMSPEQVRGLALDARSDLFSLGTVLYQLLTGREPFQAPSEFEQMERVREANPSPAHEVSKRVDTDLSEIVTKSMAKDPALRYQTAEEMSDAIETYAERAGIPLDGKALAEFMRAEFGDLRAKFIGKVEDAREILNAPSIEEEIDPDPTDPEAIPMIPSPPPAAQPEPREPSAEHPSLVRPTKQNPKWLLPAVVGMVFLAVVLVMLAILRS